MADTVTDPLEKAVLSGAIFAGPDPEGREPRAHGEYDPDDEDLLENDDSESAFTHPDDMVAGPSGPVKTTKGQSHNTGVKGVLADYRNRNNHADGSTPHKDGSELMSMLRSKSGGGNTGNGNMSDEYEDLSDGEMEAKDAYRKKRLQEMMKMGSNERSDTVGGPEYRSKFGHLREVGQAQFVKAIEEKDGSMVIVHVYSSSIRACTILNNHLSTLARAYPHVKFLRALSSELEFATGSEADVLPTLLVYENGDIYKSLVAFQRELRNNDGDDDSGDEEDESEITVAAVEEALIRHGVLKGSTAGTVGKSNNDDSDDE